MMLSMYPKVSMLFGSGRRRHLFESTFVENLSRHRDHNVLLRENGRYVTGEDCKYLRAKIAARWTITCNIQELHRIGVSAVTIICYIDRRQQDCCLCVRMERTRAIQGESSTKGKGEDGEGADGDPSPNEPVPSLKVHEWGLNPLFWAYARLFVKHVLALGTLEGIDDSHVLHGKPIQRAEVLGTVVNIKPGQTKTFGGYVKYTIDDGTGLLACTQYEFDARRGANHRERAEGHELGELLVVQGKLKRYRGTVELVIHAAREVKNPNEEVLQWLQCVELAKTTYEPPYQRDQYVNPELLRVSMKARPSRCECGAAYAKVIGYCRCVAARLARDPSFVFRDVLLGLLASNEERLPPGEYLRFQFARDVRDDATLREVATRVVLAVRPARGTIGPKGKGAASSREGDPPNRDIGRSVPGAAVSLGAGATQARDMPETLLNAKILELFRAVMFSLQREGVVHFLDKAEDVYVLISRARVLEPQVVAVCGERNLALTQENGIIRVLQSTALLHHVPGSRIRACIDSMRSSRPAGKEGLVKRNSSNYSVGAR